MSNEKLYLTNEEKDTYATKYFDFVIELSKNFVYKGDTFIDEAEMISASLYGLYRALNNFNVNSKTDIKYFIFIICKNELSDLYKKNTHEINRITKVSNDCFFR